MEDFIAPIIDGVTALSMVASSSYDENQRFGQEVQRTYRYLASQTYDNNMYEWPNLVGDNVRVRYYNIWNDLFHSNPSRRYFVGNRCMQLFGVRNWIVHNQNIQAGTFSTTLRNYWDQNEAELSDIITKNNQYPLSDDPELGARNQFLPQRLAEVADVNPIFYNNAQVNRQNSELSWDININVDLPIEHSWLPPLASQQYFPQRDRRFSQNVAEILQRVQGLEIEIEDDNEQLPEDQADIVPHPLLPQHIPVNQEEFTRQRYRWTYVNRDDQFHMVEPIFQQNFRKDRDEVVLENLLTRNCDLVNSNYIVYMLLKSQRYPKLGKNGIYRGGNNILREKTRDYLILVGGGQVLQINMAKITSEQNLAVIYRLLSESVIFCWDCNRRQTMNCGWQVNQTHLGAINESRTTADVRAADCSMPATFNQWFNGKFLNTIVPPFDLRKIFSIKEIINKGVARNVSLYDETKQDNQEFTYVPQDFYHQHPLKRTLNQLRGSANSYQANLLTHHRNYNRDPQEVVQTAAIKQHLEIVPYHNALHLIETGQAEYAFDRYSNRPQHTWRPDDEDYARWYMSLIIQDYINVKSIVYTSDQVQNSIYYCGFPYFPLHATPRGRTVVPLEVAHGNHDIEPIAGGGIRRVRVDHRPIHDQRHYNVPHEVNTRTQFGNRNLRAGARNWLNVNRSGIELTWNEIINHINSLSNFWPFERPHNERMSPQDVFNMLSVYARIICYVPRNVLTTESVYLQGKTREITELLFSDIEVNQLSLLFDQRFLHHEDTRDFTERTLLPFLTPILEICKSGGAVFPGFENIVEFNVNQHFPLRDTLPRLSIREITHTSQHNLLSVKEIVDMQGLSFLTVRARSCSIYSQMENNGGEFSRALMEYMLSFTQHDIVAAQVQVLDNYLVRGHYIFDRHILRQVIYGIAPHRDGQQSQHHVISARELVRVFPRLYNFMWYDILVETVNRLKKLNCALVVFGALDEELFQNMIVNTNRFLTYNLTKYESVINHAIQRKNRFMNGDPTTWVSSQNYKILEFVFMLSFHTTCTSGINGEMTIGDVAQNPFIQHALQELRLYILGTPTPPPGEVVLQNLPGIQHVRCFNNQPNDTDNTNHYSRYYLFRDLCQIPEFYNEIAHLCPSDYFNQRYTVDNVTTLIDVNADIFGIQAAHLAFETSTQWLTFFLRFKNTWVQFEAQNKEQYIQQKRATNPNYIFNGQQYRRDNYAVFAFNRAFQADFIYATSSRFQYLLAYLPEAGNRVTYVGQKVEWIRDGIMQDHQDYDYIVGKTFIPYPVFLPQNRWDTSGKPTEKKAQKPKWSQKTGLGKKHGQSSYPKNNVEDSHKRFINWTIPPRNTKSARTQHTSGLNLNPGSSTFNNQRTNFNDGWGNDNDTNPWDEIDNERNAALNNMVGPSTNFAEQQANVQQEFNQQEQPNNEMESIVSGWGSAQENVVQNQEDPQQNLNANQQNTNVNNQRQGYVMPNETEDPYFQQLNPEDQDHI